MNYPRANRALLGLLVLGAGTVPALAQDDEFFEEVIVTATKRAENIYEVPFAVSAFEGDKLAQQGIVDMVDVGKFVPNLNITQFSAGHNSSANAFIRGIGLQDHLITTDPGVSVYVDGVYLGRQVGQNWNLTNIERIEVLRGPQGTLYGRNSIGGAINIITKEPGSVGGARVGAQVGTRERLNADFYGDAELSDSVAVSLTGGFMSRGGIGSFVNLPNAGIEVGEMRDVFLRAALKYEPSDDIKLVVVLDGNDAEGGLRPYTTLIDEVPGSAITAAGFSNADVAADPFDNNTGQASQTRVTNEAQGLSATLDWKLTDEWATRFILSTRTSEYRAGLDDDSFFEDFLSFPESGEADQTSFEAQLNGEFGRFDLVSGFYYFTEDGENNQVGYTFNGGGPSNFFLSQEVTSAALFANLGYNVNDKLRVSGGLRYNRDEKDASTDVGTGLVLGNRSWNEVSGALSANYSFDNGLNLYGNIQSGYQSGQFPARPFCLFGNPDCFVAGDNITAINYETGLKGQIFGNTSISIAVFLTEYSDLPYQVSTTVDGGFATSNVIVDQTSTGLEWESTSYFTENVLLHVTLGYIDVDVDEQDGVKPVAPLTPELTFSLSPEFRFPLAGGADVTFRADYSFRDDMFGEPSSDPGRLTQIESRSLVNVDLSYRSANGDWVVGLYGRNITDERYDNARLNTGDYILRILSNDPSEFGVRLVKDF